MIEVSDARIDETVSTELAFNATPMSMYVVAVRARVASYTVTVTREVVPAEPALAVTRRLDATEESVGDWVLAKGPIWQ